MTADRAEAWLPRPVPYPQVRAKQIEHAKGVEHARELPAKTDQARQVRERRTREGRAHAIMNTPGPPTHEGGSPTAACTHGGDGGEEGRRAGRAADRKGGGEGRWQRGRACGACRGVGCVAADHIATP